jgi:hypothetical protein
VQCRGTLAEVRGAMAGTPTKACQPPPACVGMCTYVCVSSCVYVSVCVHAWVCVCVSKCAHTFKTGSMKGRHHDALSFNATRVQRVISLKLPKGAGSQGTVL